MKRRNRRAKAMSSILDRCAEIEAEEARKRVVTAEAENGHNPAGINDVQAVTGTKGGE